MKSCPSSPSQEFSLWNPIQMLLISCCGHADVKWGGPSNNGAYSMPRAARDTRNELRSQVRRELESRNSKIREWLESCEQVQIVLGLDAGASSSQVRKAILGHRDMLARDEQ